MENYQTIRPDFNGSVVTLWLSRPGVHNALNDMMIREISSFFNAIDAQEAVRIVIIRGEGKSFCSGADLKWMKDAFNLSPEENLKESEELSQMFRAIFNCSKIVISAVHGNVYGGGNGLVAACDLAYCLENSTFSLSETKIGMAAASITPYLLLKIKGADLKELIFSAKSFTGREAFDYGLVNQSFETAAQMEVHLEKITSLMLANGKQALIASKSLINSLVLGSMAGEMDKIPGLLAKIRVSAEAQEGFSAFIEKRKPNW